MLSEDEKRAFALSTIQPMAAYTMPYLTQVVGVIDERSGEHRGSGIFCMIEGRQAIVTAGHVIDQAAASGRFQSLSFTRGSGDPPTIVAGKILTSEQYDLAVYLPSRSFPLGKSKSFWPGTKIDHDMSRLSRDYLFVQGFPCRFSRSTSLIGNALVSEALAYGAMSRLQRKDIGPKERVRAESEPELDAPLPDDFLQPHQFALNFSVDAASFLDSGESGVELRSSFIDNWTKVFQEEGQSVLGSTPPGERVRGAYGLSGSPVWRIGAAGRKVSEWSPERSQLVGIVTNWNAEKKVLIATSASKLTETIEDE